MTRSVRLTSTLLLLLTFAFGQKALAQDETFVTVTPGDLDGWQIQTTPAASGGTSTVDFVNGPATPPLPTGSVELSVGSNGNGAAQVRNVDYNGVLLADLTELTYSTFVQGGGSGGQAPYIILNVDLDGNGTTDDQLFFEPVYQTGAYGGDPVPNQGNVAVGVWQDWDAINGGWWSLNALTFGPPLVTLETYTAAHPGARLAAPTSGAGSVRIVAGFGAGAWDDFVGNADAFVIGVAGLDTVYDFELDGDGDGVPDDVDQCLDSDLRPTVFVGNCNTGVPNFLFTDGDRNGCTITDLINHIAEDSKNHGQFVSGVAKLTNQLQKEGLITGKQKGAIQSCAAKAK